MGIEMTARVVAVVAADGSLVKSTVKNNITFFGSVAKNTKIEGKLYFHKNDYKK
jgi:hypothetical protein